MKIQYFTKRDEETRLPLFKYITVDISENASLKELFHKIHEMENIPLYRELTWNDKTFKITCKHLYQYDKGLYDYYILDQEDYKRKISEIPKMGPNGELSLHLDNEEGLAN